MKKLILGIGIPASGKSFFLEPFAQRYGYEYLCVDQIRAEFGVDRDNPLASSNNPVTYGVWDQVRLRTFQNLSEGKNVIVDATFASDSLRREFVGIGNKCGVNKIIGFYMQTPKEIAWQRNLQREHPVPEEVFLERVSQLDLKPPSIEDGFNFIISFNEKGLLSVQNGILRLFNQK